MEIKDLESVFFFPEENINKKVYTPLYIDIFRVDSLNNMHYRKKYGISLLAEHIIRNDNFSHLLLLINDYPNVINYFTEDGEPLIHTCINQNAFKCFNLLKYKGANLYSMSLGDENVYEEVLGKPEFWEYIYKDLTTKELYSEITKPGFFIHGAYQKLLRNRDFYQTILVKFKKEYPDVFSLLKKEHIEPKHFKELNQITLRVIMGYDDLDKELNECFKDNIIQESPILKF